MKSTTEKGKQSEHEAVEFLRTNGYRIIETNWRYGHEEIDIIALKEQEIIFVEVKSRKDEQLGMPEEAVTLKKQKHLINAADAYIRENDIKLDARFDVISVIDNNVIRHIPYAFYPSF